MLRSVVHGIWISLTLKSAKRQVQNSVSIIYAEFSTKCQSATSHQSRREVRFCAALSNKSTQKMHPPSNADILKFAHFAFTCSHFLILASIIRIGASTF
jgi:hypothetical protein